jgi:hypothetical protein
VAEFGASESAVEAAAERTCLPSRWHASEAARQGARSYAHSALAAAHDPALGLDRSVCLRDVVDVLNKVKGEYGPLTLAAYLTRIFTESGGPSRDS